MPIPNSAPSVQGMVRADLEVREQLGRQRYGTALQPNNGRDALRDAYEEALDLACYLRQAIAERDDAGDGLVDFARGDHVRVISAEKIGQVVNVVRERKELGGRVWEYDVVTHDGMKYAAQPRDLAPAPMYVLVERCLGSGSRGPLVYDVHATSDLEAIRARAADRQDVAVRGGRPNDTYRVAELRFIDGGA
ncbi:hypothetical protein SAMN05421748_103162 [Paractinoplanes atraurantiacus]|uniref:Uncharacterized protein n=2 Tax=Paractinoplanes atraurantiacus TaxID=1036182 RepID=A0A285H075_9ACTN|nr:hypothetical protein SAMN05421748_103162 [Actinoplanes atraurantiacus]